MFSWPLCKTSLVLGRAIGTIASIPLVETLGRLYRIAYWKRRLASFGELSHIYPHVVIRGPEKVRIGRRVNLIDFVHIWGGGGVEIGNNVMIAAHVVITSVSHHKYTTPFCDSLLEGPVIIRDNVWVGSGAIILPGVTIGENSIVGAQAVVAGDVPPYSVVAGVPARVIERLPRKANA